MQILNIILTYILTPIGFVLECRETLGLRPLLRYRGHLTEANRTTSETQPETAVPGLSMVLLPGGQTAIQPTHSKGIEWHYDVSPHVVERSPLSPHTV